MKRALPFVFFLLILVIAACGTDAADTNPDIDATVQAALAATQTAQPTNTTIPEITDTPVPTPTNTETPTPKPTDTPVPTPTNTPTATNTPSPTPFSKEDYIASANTELDYREINKSDRHIGEIVCWKGEVFNIDETQGVTGFQAYYFEDRHAVDRDNAFVVIYNDVLPDVYEETKVFVCGEVGEKFTGTNAFGGEISQPRIMAEIVDLWEPAQLPTAAPTNTPAPPTPLPIVDDFGVQKQVGTWGMKLYDVKRAKAVYFLNRAEIAQGVWLLPFVEFSNLGSGTRSPWEDLRFYLIDDLGRTFEAGYNDAWSGAGWQYQTGDIMDDINPGLVLGIVLPVDVPEDLGHVWLRVEQDPSFAICLGNASGVAMEP